VTCDKSLDLNKKPKYGKICSWKYQCQVTEDITEDTVKRVVIETSKNSKGKI